MAGPGAISQIRFEPFTESWIPAVRAFNQRLLAGGLSEDLAFPESPVLEFPLDRDAPIYMEPFLAVEGDTVRGGYYLMHERASIAGADEWVAHYRHPISEVLVDKRYKGLGSKLLADGRMQRALLYSIGMGSRENPAFKRFVADGWDSCEIPFFFRVVRAAPFLAQIQALRVKTHMKLATDIARFTGLGPLGIHLLQWSRARGVSSSIRGEVISEFGPWATNVWNSARRQYFYIAFRDERSLQCRYAPHRRNFLRIRVSDGDRSVGWAVGLVTPMRNNKYFGDMTIGTVVDCLALPGYEHAVLTMATREMERQPIDLIVTNQSAGVWCDAAAACGYWSGPSNLLFVTVQELTARLGSLAERRDEMHLNRGDGSGISRL